MLGRSRSNLLAGILLVGSVVLFNSDGLAQAPKKPGDQIRISMTSDTMLSLALAPDGKSALGGAMDGTVRLWNLESGKTERDLEGTSRAIRSVAFSPSGDMAAVAGDDEVVQLWNTKTWKPSAKLSGHLRSGARRLAFARDGRALAVASTEFKEHGKTSAEIKIWEVATVECKRVVRLQGDTVCCLAFSNDGTSLFASPGSIHVIDLASGDSKRTFQPESGKLRLGLCLSPDGKTLYAGGGYAEPVGDGIRWISEVYTFDVASGKQTRVQKDLPPFLSSVELSKDGKLLAVAGNGPWQESKRAGWLSSEVSVFEAATGKLVFTFQGEYGGMSCAIFAPDGKSMLCSDSKHLYLLEVPSGRERSILHTVTSRRLP